MSADAALLCIVGPTASGKSALALRFADDYARAGVPMLPVVASARRVGLESLVFAWLTLLTSLAVVPLAFGAGIPWIYGGTALVAGIGNSTSL